MMGALRTLTLIFLTVVATAFFVQNLATTEVVFFGWTVAAPRALVFLLIFLVGSLCGYLMHALRPRRPAAKDSTGRLDPTAQKRMAGAPPPTPKS